MIKPRKANYNQFPAGVEKYDKEALLLTWEQYLQGDNSVKEKLIVQLLAACKDILDFMVYKNTALVRLYDEVVSVMSLKTCEFVDAALDTPVENPIASYWQTIKFVVSDLASETLISSGRATRRRRDNDVPLVQREPLNEETLYANDAHACELLIDIQAAAQTDAELQFIDLTLAGFSREEIAIKLGVHHDTVTNIKNRLRSRYENRE